MSTPAVFFDAFTEIGPRHRKHLAHAWKLEELIAELDHCSISGALVASTLSTLYDPMHSNLELSRALQKHEHLFPIWNVMPNATGEFPPPDKLARLMRQHDVRAISVHPKANAWDWFADHSVELFRFLERRRILTIVPKEEIGDYSALDQFLSKFKRLRVLLVRAFWTEQRYLLPLLRKHRNLHIGFDHFQIHYGLEELTAAGLEDQLLFTSDAPQMSAGAHRCYVDYADIPEKARAKIAGGNLARLLGMKMPRERVNKNEDTIMRAARHGRPLPCPVVDMHMHILNEGLHGAGGSHRMHRGGPKGVFNLLKRLNVIGGGFMSWNVVSGDSLAGNKTVTDTLDAAPPGFWGLGSFDPTHYTQGELKKLIPQVYADKRFIGMKPYWVYGVPYHDKAYDVWWEYGNEHRLYALIHRTRDDFAEVNAMAKKYPRARWVVAHCGANHAVADRAIECMLEFPNVYAEITLTPVTLGVIDYLVKNAGEDRVVYGSDLPMRDPRQQLGWVLYSRLPVRVKRKVLAENAMRVIRPCLNRLPARCRPKV